MTSLDTLFDDLQQLQVNRRMPPVQSWQPALVGSIDIRIAKDGTWYHQGGPITRQALVQLFSGILRREGDTYFLVTPAEKLAIQVEDAPFTAVTLTRDGAGDTQRLLMTTNVGDHVPLDAQHRFWMATSDAESRPYIEVRDGLNALVVRSVYYELVELAETRGDEAVFVSCGRAFSLGAWS